MKYFLLLIVIFNTVNAKIEYKDYCQDNTKRETHIIIDLNGIDKTLYGKVIKHLSYIPHEKVSLYYYDVRTKSIVKNYTFCNPLLSALEIKKINNASLLGKAFGTDIDKMEEDKMFLQSKLIKRLANMQSKITKKKKSNFINSFSTISSDLKEHSRIVIFTKEQFNNKGRNVDLKYANVSIYQKKIPSRKIIQRNKNFFARNNAYLKSIYTRPNQDKSVSSLQTFEAKFNTIINDKKMKSKIFGLIDNKGKIKNGWYNIYGVLLTPINGKAQMKNNKIIKLNASVPSNFIYKKNIAYKGDRIDIKSKGNGYYGRYYNYAYAFEQDTFEYFEYEVN